MLLKDRHTVHTDICTVHTNCTYQYQIYTVHTDFVVVERLLSSLGAGAIEPSFEEGGEDVLHERAAASHIILTHSTNPRVDFL